ncbi:hypothetical protein RB600_005344 [Gaeumannomyces tritici]
MPDDSAWNLGKPWIAGASEAVINGAARGGHVDVVCLLLVLGAHVDSECTHNNELHTPLQHAIESNNVNLVRLFLEHGADANLKFFDGALGEAVDHRHVCFATSDLDILDLLLTRGGLYINEIRYPSDPVREEDYAKLWNRHHKHSLFESTFAYRVVQQGVEMIEWAMNRGLSASNMLLEAVKPGDYETLRYLVLDLGLKDADFYPLSEIHSWREGQSESFDQCLPAINLLVGTLSEDRAKQLPTVLCAALKTISRTCCSSGWSGGST